MWVVSAASELILRNRPHENTTGHHPTDSGPINHRRRLIYFNPWFARNDGSQIAQKNIPRYREAVRIAKWNKVEIEKIFSLSAFHPYSCLTALTDKKTPSKLRWGKETQNGVRYKVKLATIVEDDPKAPFSLATTLGWRRGRYSIPWIAPLYPWSVPYNAEC